MGDSKGGHSNKEDKTQEIHLIEFEELLFNPYFLYAVSKDITVDERGLIRFVIYLKLAGEENLKSFLYSREDIRDAKYEGLKASLIYASKLKITRSEDLTFYPNEEDNI